MDDDGRHDEILHDFFPFIRVYKDDHFVRLNGTVRIPPSIDGAGGVSSKDVVINPDTGISVRIYLPIQSVKTNKKLPIIVYFHGGAFLIESKASPLYHPYCNSLASRAEALVISVDYRLAPEHRLPTAYEDAWYALRWINTTPSADLWISEYADFDRLYLAGDSAGANLVHNMMVRLLNEMENSSGTTTLKLKVQGLIIMHPYFWGSKPVGTESDDPKHRRRFEEIWEYICPSAPSVDNQLLNPLVPEMKKVFATLPCEKVIICVAELDDLKERGKAYYECLRSSGWNGKVELIDVEGKGHVFHLFDPACKEAHDLMKKVVEFVNSR